MPRDLRDGGAGEQILHYLVDHPDAADTVDGIRQWWLLEGEERSSAEVRAVLERLVERHLITRVDRPGMSTVYSGPRRDRRGTRRQSRA